MLHVYDIHQMFILGVSYIAFLHKREEQLKIYILFYFDEISLSKLCRLQKCTFIEVERIVEIIIVAKGEQLLTWH